MARHKLVAMRRRRMHTQEDVAHLTGRTRGSISDYETGKATPSVNTARALAKVYEVTFEDLWDALDSNGSDEQRRLLPGFDHFMTLEQSATSFRTWEPVLVPGLLQTRSYALAVVGDDELVERRMRRQEALTRDDTPLQLAAVIDESVLHRPIGGAEVLATQLDHLSEVADRSNVTLHVLPFDAPRQPMSFGAVVILGFDGWTSGGLVYQHNRTDASYLNDPSDIDRHMDAYHQLIELALTPAESINRIGHRRKELSGNDR